MMLSMVTGAALVAGGNGAQLLAITFDQSMCIVEL